MSATTKLTNWLHRQKDSSVSFAVEKALVKILAPYGELLEFQLQTGEHRASLQMLLRGETEPVTLFIDEYRLTQDATRTEVTILKARASRDWLAQLLQDFLVRSLPIPEKYAGYAKFLL